MKILSIDIGIINLAMVGIDLQDNYLDRKEIIKTSEITLCELINITELLHNCKDSNCELFHDKIMCDYIDHLFKHYRMDFDSADIILIERQPIFGHVAVQELIMKEYRKKSVLISPISMLNFFGILHIDYDSRKIQTEKIATEYLNGFKNFTFNSERKHDMSDAFCILYYYLSMERKDYIKKIEEKQNKINYGQAFKNFSSYMYKE